MLSSKSKGFFVEVSPFSVLAVSASSSASPCALESIKEFPSNNGLTELRNYTQNTLGAGKNKRFAMARCSVYPESRFYRRHTIESAAKAKDVSYFTDLMANSFRIDPAKNIAAVINAQDGSDFDPSQPMAAQKEVLVCGAGKTDMGHEQDSLVEAQIYPVTLELGTLSTLGGLIDYLRWKKEEQPVLVLEITPESANLFIVSASQVDIARPIPYGLNSMFPTIKEELGLKDEESAQKLFYSNTFDFTEMGSSLLRKMLKELQSSTGFYEVQTGQSIGHIFLSILPRNLGWISQVLSRSLGVKPLTIDYKNWLLARGVTAPDTIALEQLDGRWLGLMSMLITFEGKKDGVQK